jgi:hypothetical protein
LARLGRSSKEYLCRAGQGFAYAARTPCSDTGATRALLNQISKLHEISRFLRELPAPPITAYGGIKVKFD